MNIFSCRRGKKRKEEEENPKNTHVEIESRESFSSLTQAIEKRIFRESFRRSPIFLCSFSVATSVRVDRFKNRTGGRARKKEFMTWKEEKNYFSCGLSNNFLAYFFSLNNSLRLVSREASKKKSKVATNCREKCGHFQVLRKWKWFVCSVRKNRTCSIK